MLVDDPFRFLYRARADRLATLQTASHPTFGDISSWVLFERGLIRLLHEPSLFARLHEPSLCRTFVVPTLKPTRFRPF
jgi:hypothetical protein